LTPPKAWRSLSGSGLGLNPKQSRARARVTLAARAPLGSVTEIQRETSPASGVNEHQADPQPGDSGTAWPGPRGSPLGDTGKGIRQHEHRYRVFSRRCARRAPRGGQRDQLVSFTFFHLLSLVSLRNETKRRRVVFSTIESPRRWP
jgi:hypothetical protein